MHHPSFMVLNPISIVSGSDVFMAVHKGDLKELKTLLNDRQEKNPVLVEEDGSTVIYLAAVLGHLNILKWYKEELNCTNMNPKNNKGNTPLTEAIKLENLDMIKLYIDCGYNATGKFNPLLLKRALEVRIGIWIELLRTL